VALLRRRRGNGRGPGAGPEETTIFFATDLHGSETCFRKFVAAAGFYGADLLVLGGDLTGKLVVPLVSQPDGRYEAWVHGRRRLLDSDGAADLERQARVAGSYTRRMTPEEHQHLEANPAAVEELFAELMTDTLRRWLRHANERLAGSEVRILTAPGNDDPWLVDDVLREYGGERVALAEGEIVEVAPGHELLTTGWTNKTPWNTPREYPEEAIAQRLDDLAAGLANPAGALFNVHVPPYDSRLDTAPLLGQDLKVRTSMGGEVTASVGSTAVRDAIERHQPLLSLHGHIHESGGTARLGRTLAVNAGSEYGEGVLRGVLVTVGGGKVLRYQATTG
jgi:Icc-related predicted phosphoesterase